MALKEQLLSSLKKAMRGEMDSVTLYGTAANKASDPEVREFFSSRREEERLHYNYLLQYYQEISNDLHPSDLVGRMNMSDGYHLIISPNFLQRIGEDQILYSAVSTALLLEKDAIEHYRNCMDEAETLTLKSFYELMIRWESKHYDELLTVQKEAEQFYWQINQFEPF